MSPRRLVFAVVLVVVAASVGVGAAPSASTAAAGAVETPSPTPSANASESPLGERLTMVMQANAAQAEGSVENGMWAAAFANASNASERRALVERRVGQLNGSMTELQAERRALQAALRNGTINRTTYRARLSAIVGRLSALDEGIDETSERGAAVGVNQSRLDELRRQARNLSGAEVGRLARNLTGDRGPPGLFDEGPPGQADERGPGEAANRTNRSSGDGQGQPGNESDGNGEGPPTDGGPPGNESEGNDDGQGPPSDSDRGDSGNESEGGGDGQGPPTDSDRGDSGGDGTGDDGGNPPTDSGRQPTATETESDE